MRNDTRDKRAIDACFSPQNRDWIIDPLFLSEIRFSRIRENEQRFSENNFSFPINKWGFLRNMNYYFWENRIIASTRLLTFGGEFQGFERDSLSRFHLSSSAKLSVTPSYRIPFELKKTISRERAYLFPRRVEKI